ncbi:UDP-N-acetylglucosamine 2-epimerase [Pseudoalteromonas sp. JC3]|uniref:UDP-N-acetylglucosamine 2-epimerase n=1 Tax=Pseudoalteromonas sp. JC3 TaxID=2810196 RepID=UPI0019D19A7F|nr:UDP-N-acetylglucosamine 2-epimerase [Pseudoalteromonas sp. JC3]MBR8842640.1 UDP-N-acetylglucosamine 2-epimerase (hydrolyzing) [Pseudoalteromonas sp. JC3]WJE10114.1 UDP-N-acetylglucosamine 2-epimerase [Pseudoalteromonas sp. JC3]
MKKVAVLTTSRAEFGLLYDVICKIEECQSLSLQLVVSGSHLADEHGTTINEIIDLGLSISAQLPILAGSSQRDNVNAIAKAASGFSDILEELRPHLLIIMGDRFELLGFANAALIHHIPIAHFSGGEVTTGAIDDSIRHALTKMSYLHFTSNYEHEQRVIRMGECPTRVFNVGEPGLTKLYQRPKFSLVELNKSLSSTFQKNQFFLFTYHPVTTQGLSENEHAIELILKAIDKFSEFQVLITYPNADYGYDVILKTLISYAENRPERVVLVPSLGFELYHTALYHCALVLGNSSSALIEAPSLKKPSINIGTRQDGRLCAASVLHCSEESVVEAIEEALSEEFLTICASAENPYGDPESLTKIMRVLKRFKPISTVKKVFYDKA